MQDLSTLNDLARAEIELLERDGIKVTADQVCEINALGWAVEAPETRRLLARGRPVPLADTYLWPLTLRALDWIERNKVSTSAASPAMAYAMAHGRSDGDELDGEGRDAERKVMAWYRRLRCSKLEMIEAVRQVDAQDAKPETPPNPDGRPMTIGDFSAFMSATCGGDADFWERRCCVGYALAVLTTVVMQNHADKRPCAHDPRIVAERALGYAIEKIRNAHKAQAVACG